MKLLKMRYITVLMAGMLLCSAAFAGDEPKKKAEINWLTLDDVQVEMKKKPKKVWIDMYTDWCVYCKKMDKSVYSDPDVIAYMNEHFYAVKFNPQEEKQVMFLSKRYSYDVQHNANSLAVELMKENISYPTNIFMDEYFQNPVAVPGYQPIPQLETVFSLLMQGLHKKGITLEEYSKTYEPTWGKS